VANTLKPGSFELGFFLMRGLDARCALQLRDRLGRLTALSSPIIIAK
jgi:hypothetical protein